MLNYVKSIYLSSFDLTSDLSPPSRTQNCVTRAKGISDPPSQTQNCVTSNKYLAKFSIRQSSPCKSSKPPTNLRPTVPTASKIGYGSQEDTFKTPYQQREKCSQKQGNACYWGVCSELKKRLNLQDFGWTCSVDLIRERFNVLYTFTFWPKVPSSWQLKAIALPFRATWSPTSTASSSHRATASRARRRCQTRRWGLSFQVELSAVWWGNEEP